LDFSEDARFDYKIGSALREIDSDYVSLCADDDIVFVDAIEECINELDCDVTLAACHGIYLNFAVSQTLVRLNIEYASPSIDMDDVVDRACQLLMRYEALNYAVYRRPVMIDVIDAVAQTPQTMFWELFSALAPLVNGKVKRLPRLYHGRRANVAGDRMVQHPATWIASHPEDFAEAFLKYRERLFRYFQAKGVDVGPDVQKAITQAHVIYLCRELRDGAGIRQALAGTSSPLARINLAPCNMMTAKVTGLNAWLGPDSWLGSRIRKSWLGSRIRKSWLCSRIRKLMVRPDMIYFRGHDQSVVFTATQNIQEMLTDEIVADFSRYCRATAGL
jgi:hypothetical protein